MVAYCVQCARGARVTPHRVSARGTLLFFQGLLYAGARDSLNYYAEPEPSGASRVQRQRAVVFSDLTAGVVPSRGAVCAVVAGRVRVFRLH